MTTVAVVARSAVMRAGLEAIIEASPGLEVVGSIAAIEALATGGTESADVMLLDIDHEESEWPFGAYADDIGLFRALDPHEPALVLLTDASSSDRVAGALRAGAQAVISRDATADEVVAAIVAAAAGLVTVSRTDAERLLAVVAPVRGESPVQVERLSPREIEVLTMLAEGVGNKTIARRLGISEHTVKFHLGSIFGKLSATSRTEAVMQGIRQGLIML